MINTLKYCQRYVKNENRINIGVLYSAFEEKLNRRTYQFYDFGRCRNVTVVAGVRKIFTWTSRLQTSSTGTFSSAINETNGGQLIVRHDPNEEKFYLEVAGCGIAFLEYKRKDELIILKHTSVPNELCGRGVGKILAKVALEYVAKHDLQLEIQCPFIRNYVSKYEPKYIKYMQK